MPIIWRDKLYCRDSFFGNFYYATYVHEFSISLWFGDFRLVRVICQEPVSEPQLEEVRIFSGY